MNSDMRYSTQAQCSLIFLSLGQVWVVQVILKLIKLNLGWLGCIIQNISIIFLKKKTFLMYLYENLNKKIEQNFKIVTKK